MNRRTGHAGHSDYLGIGRLSLIIAHVVATFWPDQIPSVRGAGIVYSVDDNDSSGDPCFKEPVT